MTISSSSRFSTLCGTSCTSTSCKASNANKTLEQLKGSLLAEPPCRSNRGCSSQVEPYPGFCIPLPLKGQACHVCQYFLLLPFPSIFFCCRSNLSQAKLLESCLEACATEEHIMLV